MTISLSDFQVGTIASEGEEFDEDDIEFIFWFIALQGSLNR